MSLELEKNYAIKNSLNDLQLPPGSKNMHLFTDKWSEKDCNYQNDLKSSKNTEAEIKYEPVYEISTMWNVRSAKPQISLRIRAV